MSENKQFFTAASTSNYNKSCQLIWKYLKTIKRTWNVDSLFVLKNSKVRTTWIVYAIHLASVKKWQSYCNFYQPVIIFS